MINAPNNPDPLLDARAASTYLGLASVVRHPEQAVRALCRKRRMKSTIIAGKIMIRRSWLESYIQKGVRDLSAGKSK